MHRAAILKTQSTRLELPILFVFLLLFSFVFQSGFAQEPSDSLDPKVEQLKHLDHQLETIASEIRGIQESMRKDSIIPEDTVFVRILGKDLWPIYLSFGPLSPKERVDLIQDNLDEISYFEMSSVFDSLKIVKTNQGNKVQNDDEILFFVTNEDALLLNSNSKDLATEYIAILQENMEANTLIHTNEDLLWRIGKVIGIIFVLYLIIKLLNVGYRKLNKFLVTLQGTSIHGLKVKNFEIINEKQVVKVVFFVTKIIRLIFILFFVYLSLPLIFGLFPWTETLAGTLLGYVLDPLREYFWAFIDYIPNIISIAIISYIGHFIIRFINYLSLEVESGNVTINDFYPEWAKPTANLARFAVYIILLIFIFPFLPGSDSPIFKGVSVFVGILITMGSSSSVNNIVAGLVLTYMRPFKKGDRIKIDAILGFVTEKTLLVTRLRTAKQEIITIPNSKILGTNIINYSTSIQENDGVIIHNTITIGYDVPWRKVHKALLTAASQIETIAKEPKPFVLQSSLDDFYVAYEINAYVTNVKTIIGTTSKLNEQIQDVFRDMGIEILSPHYKALRDGQEITIPKKVKEDRTFKAEQVDDHTPELDQQQVEEEMLAKKRAKEKKAEVPKSFFELMDKVTEISKTEDEKKNSELGENEAKGKEAKDPGSEKTEPKEKKPKK